MGKILSLKDAQPQARKLQLPGLHLIGDLYGCRGDRRYFFDDRLLGDFCRARVDAAGLTAVGSLFHSFGEHGGVTGMVVLAESHLSIHTWPEENYVTLDVYVCNYSTDNRDKARRLFEDVADLFKPETPHYHSIDRA
jgi:S-adenosylmethionine decarboxylase